MIKISGDEVLTLKEFLATNLYTRVKNQTLEELDSHIHGSDRSADNLAIDLAIEKGVQMAFKHIESLTNAPHTKPMGVHARTIQKRQHNNT